MPTRVRSALSLTAVIAPSLYAGLTVAVHLLNPSDPWTQYTLSDLALTRYGWIETLSLCVLAVCVVTIAYGLHKSTLYRRERGMALAMLGITSLALFVIAGFKTSDTAIVTPSVLIHRVSVGVLTVCFPAACLVLVPALRGDRRWKSLALYSGVVGAIGLILDISGASIPRDLQQGVAGLWEKVFVANGLIWCQVFAVRLLRVSHQTPTRDGGRKPRWGIKEA